MREQFHCSRIFILLAKACPNVQLRDLSLRKGFVNHKLIVSV